MDTFDTPKNPIDAATEADAAEYKVGHGRPPLHSRFKPGQSGNPAGRPRGAKASPRKRVPQLLRECLERRVLARLSADGPRRRIRLGDLVVRRLTEAAEAGDVQAMCELMRTMRVMARDG